MEAEWHPLMEEGIEFLMSSRWEEVDRREQNKQLQSGEVEWVHILLDLKAMNLECKPMEEDGRGFSVGEEWAAHIELDRVLNSAGSMEWEETKRGNQTHYGQSG